MKYWFGILLAVFVLGPMGARAATVGLAPLKLNVTAVPGVATTTELIIVNRGSDSVRLSVSAADIGMNAAGTGVALATDIAPEYSAAPFLTFGWTAAKLEPGAALRLPVTVTLPPTAPSGGRRAAVLVQFTGTDKQGTTMVASRIGALLFVDVAGSGDAAAHLERFGLAERALTQRTTRYVFSVSNDGSTNLNPYGFITVANWWGGAQKIPIEPNFILPHTTRTRDLVALAPVWPGRYVATLALNPGYTTAIATGTVVYWYWPWWSLGLLALLGFVAGRKLFSA